MKISRQAYAAMYGPTIGDRIRLDDTELWIEIEHDHTHYGEEVMFGGGKVIRDGMGQSQRYDDAVMDTVITNVIIIDWWGIVKADVGLKNGRIAAIGKAGNPDTQPDVDIVIGPGTEIISGEGRILTAGAVDTHVHYICPQQVDEALRSGLTTNHCGEIIRIHAADEPVATAYIENGLPLGRLCYHLGNRHVSLALGMDEDGRHWVRFPPDHVLEELAVLLGATISHHQAPFDPESGAYAHAGREHAHEHGHNHGHAHSHSHGHGHSHDH